MSSVDHAEIAQGMRCIKLPRRSRGRQSDSAVKIYNKALDKWCREIIRIADTMDFKIGARDWCYVLENAGSLTKGQFDLAEKLIGSCRKDGHLPLDICVVDEGRPTSNLESIDSTSVDEEAESIIERIADAHLLYVPISFWENQKYYVEIGVEKIGLHSLFEKPTEEFYVPLTNLGGWCDINRRAEMMMRFSYWHERGKICVLLLCVDHDAGGLHIVKYMRKNLLDLANQVGWWPDEESLKIERFGLNKDFIDRHRLSWIPNLETSSGGRLDDPLHNDHDKEYVQSYIKQFGVRKVEANALIVRPEAGRNLCRQAILKYVNRAAANEYQRRLDAEQEKVRRAVARLLLKGRR